MKLQFFFIDGDSSDDGWSKEGDHNWTSTEKSEWLKKWYKTTTEFCNCKALKWGTTVFLQSLPKKRTDVLEQFGRLAIR